MIRAILRIGGLCLLLSACATPRTEWEPRADADMTTDLAACSARADNLDMLSPSTYSDGLLGPAAAMARQVERTDGVRGLSERDVFVAVRDRCMAEKGWTETE